MCCLMRGTSGDILEADEGQAIVLETVEECRKVAAAAGHDPGEKGMTTVRSFLTQKGSKFAASMLHDLEKGAMVEADHVVGDMIARAKKAGIATPNLRLAYAHLQVYLARRARGGIGKPALETGRPGLKSGRKRLRLLHENSGPNLSLVPATEPSDRGSVAPGPAFCAPGSGGTCFARVGR